MINKENIMAFIVSYGEVQFDLGEYDLGTGKTESEVMSGYDKIMRDGDSLIHDIKKYLEENLK